jgi:hypothetical protein
MAAAILPFALTVALLTPAQAAPLPADGLREDRLRFMKDRASHLNLYRPSASEPFALKDEPILRYSNPERDSGTSDGATFLWLEGPRPIAAVSFGIRGMSNAVFLELTSFVGEPFVCRRGSTTVWSPQMREPLARELPDAPPAANTAGGRLTQMRTLARRFSATCYFKNDATQLRLLPQPLYRYPDEKEGILDAGLFAMVVSNDPEMFLTVEAISNPEPGKSPWRYSLARMSSLKQVVRLDDKEVWMVPGYYTIPPAERKNGPYVEVFQGNYAPSDKPQVEKN